MIHLYEHHTQPILPRMKFIQRMLTHGLAATGVLVFALGIGILGYHLFEDLPWLDALLNASMILGGMGPVNELHTTAGKLFASFYSLFSGVVFLVSAGLVIAPLAHRLLHWLHLETESPQ
jgi:NhaP-type Na+/H+ or K+/H+ antiporter